MKNKNLEKIIKFIDVSWHANPLSIITFVSGIALGTYSIIDKQPSIIGYSIISCSGGLIGAVSSYSAYNMMKRYIKLNKGVELELLKNPILNRLFKYIRKEKEKNAATGN